MTQTIPTPPLVEPIPRLIKAQEDFLKTSNKEEKSNSHSLVAVLSAAGDLSNTVCEEYVDKMYSK